MKTRFSSSLVEDFFGLPLLQIAEKSQGADGFGLGDQGHAEKRQDLLGESLQGKGGFFYFRNQEGATGKGYGPGCQLPESNRFEGFRRFFEAERGNSLEQAALFIQETQNASVRLQDFGAGQGDPVQKLVQLQGRGDGHPDAVKGAELGDPPLGLEGELAAADRGGNLAADDREQELLLGVEEAGRFSSQHQDPVKENVVGNGKCREKRKGGKGTGGVFPPGRRKDLHRSQRGFFSPRNRGRELRPGLDRSAPAKRGARCWQTGDAGDCGAVPKKRSRQRRRRRSEPGHRPNWPAGGPFPRERW